MSPRSGVGDRRWSLETDPNLAMALPGLTRRGLVELRVEVVERLRGVKCARGEQRRVNTTKLIQARLIRVEGLRVAELPRPIHTQCNSFSYRPRLRGRQLNSTGVFDKYALGRTSPAGRSYA